jgi:two-component system, NarL family, nitrate/nitrite response regulator NarL
VVIVSRAMPALDRSEAKARLRALVIDRQPLFLAAVGELLSAPPLHAEVVVTTHSDEGIARAKEEAFDLVFCDVRAKPVTGAEVASALADVDRLRVILLADSEDASTLLAALRSGAAGFFTKDASLEEFVEGIQAVLAGHVAVGQNLVQETLALLVGSARSQPQLGHLSPAERDVLGMVAQAQSIQTIAATRGISEKTVRNQLANIYRKLHLRNRTEAVLWATRERLAHPPASSQD